MGGSGASGGQRNQSAGNLTTMGTLGTGNMQDLNARAEALGSQVTPFYGSRMSGGLPFYPSLTNYQGGTIAQSFAPQYGAVLRNTSQYSNMPSGYRDALMNNLRAKQATAFDNSQVQAMMANEMAKQQGAAGLTGEQQIYGGQALGYGGLGAGASQAILNAPQRPGVLGTLGGLALGGLQTAAMV